MSAFRPLGLVVRNRFTGRAGFRRIEAVILVVCALGTGAATPLAAQTFTEFAVPGGAPGAITAGPDGNLWFTEPSADRIGRMTTTGVVSESRFPRAASLRASLPVPTATSGSPSKPAWQSAG